MAGTIYSGTYVSGIALANPATQNPATIAAAGYVTNQTTLHNGDAVYGYPGFAWTVGNFGTILVPRLGDGIQLESGGSVANAGSIAAAFGIGVEIDNAVGAVTNTGTISGSGAGGRGISLGAGGVIVNGAPGATGALITAYNPLAVSGSPGTVTNYGTILGTGRFEGYSVSLQAGGSLTNRAGALIETQVTAVRLGGSGAVANFGTIENLGTFGAAVAFAYSGGTLTNAGTIAGNSGTAVAFSGYGDRLILDPGAAFSGLVNGGTANDTLELAAGGGSGTLSGFGASFTGFGTVAIDPGASWQFAAANTIAAGYTITDSGTIANAGTIASTVTMGAGGSLDNQASGAIAGGPAVYGSGGPSAVGNSGTIAAPGIGGIGVDLSAGGSVTNGVNGAPTALIAGVQDGVSIGGIGAVVNSGTIAGTGTAGAATGAYIGIDLASGYIGNGSPGSPTGLIEGVQNGIRVEGTGTVVNFGTILASGAVGSGVYFAAGGSTLTNAGTILGNGGTAVAFAGSGNRVIEDPGAAFSGVVNGGAANDTLELAAGAATGMLSGLGSQFTGFTAATIDAGASWQFAGADTIAAGTVLTDIGTLANAGTLSDAGTLVTTGILTNSGTIVAAGVFSALGILINDGVVTGAVTLTSGGYLANLSSGLIGGLVLGASAATLVNAGTIGGQGGTAVAFAGGGNRVVVDPGAAFSGLVAGGAGNDALELAAGNGTGALSGLGTRFTGFTDIAVDAGASWQLAGANVIAAGTVLSDAGTLAYTGTLTNSGTIAATGVFSDPGTLINNGTITGAVTLTSGGYLANLSSGLIGGPVLGTAAATVVNAGTIGGAGGTAVAFSGGGNRVVLDPGAAFSGLVDGGAASDALELAAGGGAGTLSGLGIRFTGFTDIAVDAGASWQLVGANAIAAGTALSDAGTLVNGGSIAATGVFSDPGTLINSGTITGTVTLTSGGYLANLSSGLIGGPVLGTAATLVNAGTIGGGAGTAVRFGGGDDLLVVDPGAVFAGRVDGGAGANAIELTAGDGAGALFGLGAKFRNFASVYVDPGAVWRVSDAAAAAPDFSNDGRIVVGGGHTLLLGAVGEDPGARGVVAVRTGGTVEFAGGVDPQQTVRFADATGTLVLDDPQDFGAPIRGFQAGDTIDVKDVAADGLTYADGVLSLTSGGEAAATLAIAGDFTASQFALTPDGQGGTLVTAVPGQLFAFTFVYADGGAYYQGTVADDGSLGYAAVANSPNPAISVPGGVYTLAADGPATTQSAGAVSVTGYFASPPQANAAQEYAPLATNEGRFDGTGGLGSESDAILVNGTAFAFSPGLEFHPLLAS